MLKGRPYDIELITSNGGILKTLSETDYQRGIDRFLENLYDKNEGFLVDEHTFLAYVANKKKWSPKEYEDLKDKITMRPKYLQGRHSFGMLVRSKTTYKYLKHFVDNNQFQMDTCRRNYQNIKLVDYSVLEFLEKGNLFSPDDGMFYPVLKYSGAMLGLVCVFGIVHEVWRKMKICK